MAHLSDTFTKLGGRFVTDAGVIAQKLSGIKAFIFDWDGVFNNGQKGASGGSHFSEVDSMGTNLLRFSYYLQHNQHPITAVISGEKNDTAFYFCERECFHYSFFKTANKTDALKFICEKQSISENEVAYVFDDVLDLSIAGQCGLRVLINHQANALFMEYCIKHKLADYITASDGNNYGVREAAELLIGLNGNYDEVIAQRTHYSEKYATYIQHRRAIGTEFYTVKDGVVQQTKRD